MRIFRSIPSGSNVPLALTIGNFDGVHLGHRAMLQTLKQAAHSRGLPAAVMTFEPHPREFFAPDRAPARLTRLRDKLALLAAEGIDQVYVCRFNYAFAQTSPDDFVDRILVRGLAVRWLLVGDDFRFGARRAGDRAFLDAAAARSGYAMHSMESVVIDGERVSSSSVRDALAAGELDRATTMLGRPYAVSGRVVRGDRIGRTLGFPTANLRLPARPLPFSGIFAVELHGVGRHAVRGVASLGVRPTVTDSGEPRLEVHLFDFDQDIYGVRVRVDFLRKFRDEEKYGDLETLRRQIELDAANARAFFRDRDAAARPL
jgi:riboflavin kinase/FMN adenylyltransferase